METHADYDVIVLGAGPAGFTAGIYLGRFGIKTLILEAMQNVVAGESLSPDRSSVKGVYHNVPGFPNGIPREELKWRGIEQAQHAECDYRIDEALSITQEHLHYTIGCRTRSYTANCLIFAMGIQDEWPDLPGLRHFAGTSLFWSVEANGFEAKGRSAAVLGHDDHSALEAVRLQAFTPEVSLLANGEKLDCSQEICDILQERNIPVYMPRIKTIQGEEGLMNGVILEDNTELDVEMMYSPSQKRIPRSRLAQELGVHVDILGFIHVNERFETNIHNIYAVGDITSRGPEQVITSYYHGMVAAWSIYENRSQKTLQQLLSTPKAHHQ